jgi:putative transposase
MGMDAPRPRVARIMKKKGLRSVITGEFKVCTTESNHSLEVSPNVFKREFIAKGPSEKWVSNITYIRTQGGWLYLPLLWTCLIEQSSDGQ